MQVFGCQNLEIVGSCKTPLVCLTIFFYRFVKQVLGIKQNHISFVVLDCIFNIM